MEIVGLRFLVVRVPALQIFEKLSHRALPGPLVPLFGGQRFWAEVIAEAEAL
jgi:hypothetical protein